MRVEFIVVAKTDASIVAGGDVPGPNCVGALHQLPEFQSIIADHAGVRRSAANVLIGEVVDNPIEALLEIERVKRDSELPGDEACVRSVARAAAPAVGSAGVIQTASVLGGFARANP